MSELSSTTCVTKGSAWIAREPDGSMIVGTFTDYRIPMDDHSLSNVRITRRWTLQDGLTNWIGNALLRVLIWVASSTNGEVKSAVLTSTPRSRSGCSSNCCAEPVSSNA